MMNDYGKGETETYDDDLMSVTKSDYYCITSEIVQSPEHLKSDITQTSELLPSINIPLKIEI